MTWRNHSRSPVCLHSSARFPQKCSYTVPGEYGLASSHKDAGHRNSCGRRFCKLSTTRLWTTTCQSLHKILLKTVTQPPSAREQLVTSTLRSTPPPHHDPHPVTRRTDMNVFMSQSARSYRDDISPNRGRRRKFESDSDIRVALMPRRAVRGSRRFDLTRVGKVGRCCLRLRDGSRQAKYADSGGHEMARYRTRDWRPLLSPAGYTGTGNGTSRRGNGYPRYVGGRRCALSPGDADLTISHGRY